MPAREFRYLLLIGRESCVALDRVVVEQERLSTRVMESSGPPSKVALSESYRALMAPTSHVLIPISLPSMILINA
jgi:hypothetical protein